MQTVELFAQTNDYNIWANREFLQFFAARPNSSGKAVRIFAHLLLAEKTWLRRIGENLDTSGFDFWSNETIEDCAALLAENEREIKLFFAVLTEDRLDTVFNYKNSRGASFKNTWREALTHVFAHSAYHRGQLALAVREAGDAPPYTDFIQFLRVKNR